MELYYFLNNSQNMDSQSRGFRLLFRCAGSFNYRPISFTLPITVSLLSYARSLSLSLSLPLTGHFPFPRPLLSSPLSLPFSHSPWLLPPLSIISHCNHTHTVFLLFLLSHSLSPLYYSFLSPIFTLPLFLYII